MFYPVYMNLKSKRVVVIGGGRVAEQKVLSLIGTGARITVISPELTTRLDALADAQSIEVHQRCYAPGDCAEAALVLSATDDPEISRAIRAEAAESGTLVNTADQPDLCDFIMPAVVRRGKLTVAISTEGSSPALAARLRRKLTRIIGPEYELFLELLAHSRPEIRRRVQDSAQRKALHYRLVDSNILTLLRRNDLDGARRRVNEILDGFACQEEGS